MGKRTGKGRLKTRCTACQKEHRREVARLSALKCYKPVVRTYYCAACDKEFQQEGRGKLTKTCPDCMDIKQVVQEDAEITEAEEMLKGIFD